MANSAEPSTAPFRKIALSLSGGGARAVGYHLGTLDYLHRTRLLENVHILSTVSGGTLVGASYALAVEEDMSFQDLFFDFFDFFPKANMFEGILEILNRKEPPSGSGRRNFATAFAELYHEEFFSHYFSAPFFASIKSHEDDSRHRLEDVIFNATEFRTGIAFRFQKCRQACKIGNGNVWIDPAQANEMRMADIVSASSCIPGGFEPFGFPDDFHWPQVYRHGEKQGQPFGSTRLETAEGELDVDSIALMDGGVYDNQGITSVLLAISRRVDASGTDFEGVEQQDPQSWANWAHDLLAQFSIVDLYIVSDTPLLKETMYSIDKASVKPPSRFARWLNRRTLGDVNRFAWIVATVLVVSAVASFVRLIQTGQLAELRIHLAQGVAGYLPLVYESLATLIPLLVAGLLGTVMWSLRARLNRAAAAMKSKLPTFDHPPWYYLKHLRISDLWGMLRLRAGSLLALSADIYMHRIRQLGYGILFGHKELIPSVMTNEIYAIKSSTDSARPLPPNCSAASADVRGIVDLCSGMATKASFDRLSPDTMKQELPPELSEIDLHRFAHRNNGEPRTDLDILVACGQISTCYNLIRHLQRKMAADDTPNAEFQEMLERACDDWNDLQASPFMYVDERLQRGRSAEHADRLAEIAARAGAAR